MATTPVPIPDKTPELEALWLEQGQIEVDQETGCRYWTGPVYENGGYGRLYVPSSTPGQSGRYYRTHRVSYAWARGDTEMILDHLCHDPLECKLDRNGWCEHRRCVNPDHLEPTTRGDNVRRGLPGSPLWNPLGNSLKGKCVNGHLFTHENTFVNTRGERQCRICLCDAQSRHRAAHRDEINAKRRAERKPVTYDERPCAHCGKPFTPKRSTGQLCRRRDCINSRQRDNRDKRLGR